MIDRVEEWVAESWADWLTEGRPRHLDRVVLRTRRRSIVFFFADGRSQPEVVVKVAGAADGDGLSREESILRDLSNRLPGNTGIHVPEPLGRLAEGDTAALAMTVLRGRRLTLPALRSQRPTFLGRRALIRGFTLVSDWSTELAATTGPHSRAGGGDDLVGQFAERFAPDGALTDRVLSFGRAIEPQLPAEPVGWQHGDMSVGNILLDRGRVRMVDWAAARPDYGPWFDQTYFVLGLVRSVAKQTRAPISDVVARMFGQGHWVGSALGEVIESRWGHAITPASALTLTAMRTAVRAREDQLAARAYASIATSLLDADRASATSWTVPVF